jgi:hypothetical protein
MPGVMRRQSISKQKKPGSPGFIKTPTDPTKKRRDEKVAGRKPTTRPKPGPGVGPKPKPVKKRGR